MGMIFLKVDTDKISITETYEYAEKLRKKIDDEVIILPYPIDILDKEQLIQLRDIINEVLNGKEEN